MSEEGANSSTYKPVVTRSIGVGLTRSNLSLGARPGARLSRDLTPLTSPSRVIISGASLTPKRTPSDRYQGGYTGYSRLGDLRKNTSAPNVANLLTNVKGIETDNKLQTDGDINQTKPSTPRINLPTIATPARYSGDISRFPQISGKGRNENNVDESENSNKSVDIVKDSSVNIGASKSQYNKESYIQGGVNKLPAKTYAIDAVDGSSVQRSKVKSFDLDLEDDEEDACIAQEVKVTETKQVKPGQTNVTSRTDSTVVEPITVTTNTSQLWSSKETTKAEDLEPMRVDVPSTHSPSKDSGYSSPRFQTNVDSFSASITSGSRSNDIPDPKQVITMETNPAPQRPARTKSLSRKSDLGTAGLQLSPRQPDINSKTQNGNSGNIGSDRNNTQRVDACPEYTGLTENNALRGQGQTESSRSQENSESKEMAPRAKPRTHRRLTRRAVSFKRLEEDEYIGFASLPEQVHRKAVRRGFEFTLMVVGETGLGKSTLINSLFLMDLYKDRKVGNTEERVQKTTDIEKKELEIEEKGVKLKLTIVDTPGFNDAVNAEESWRPIVNYIDGQFDSYFTAESGLNRKNIVDTRVHCCLYFISPYGHGLRQSDIMVMRKLHHKVNIIPLIAKSDMLTKQEAKRLKEKVLEEIERHKIQIYQYPECDSDEDEEFKQQDKDLKNSIPFAVVGSNTVVEAGGKKIRGRMYPWGIVEVENPKHSDFTKLRQMLISTHMQDLKDVTVDVHYENYRAEHISEQMSSNQRERGKLKRDSVANMESSLETEKLLQEKEAEIKKMQEMLSKMQAQLHNQNSPRANGRVTHHV